MTALYAIMVKEVIHIIRDPRSLFTALVLPLVLLVLFGYAISLDVRSVTVTVVDHDVSQASRQLVQTLTADGAIVVSRATSEAQLDDQIARGTVSMGVIIPPGYGAALARGQTSAIQVTVDGTEASFAGLAMGQVGGVLGNDAQVRILDAMHHTGRTGDLPGLRAEPRVFYNESLNGTWFIIPGLIAVLVAMLAALLTSQCVAREYEQGTIEQILVSPVSGPALMVGKLLPYVVVGAVQVAMVTMASHYLFEVPIRGSLALLAGATLLYLVGALALGLMLSTVLKSQQVAMQIALVATILPSLMLSGFMFPITNMPVPLQWISYGIPARYYIAITKGLFLKGLGAQELAPQLLAMALFAAVMMALATSRFRSSLS